MVMLPVTYKSTRYILQLTNLQLTVAVAFALILVQYLSLARQSSNCKL